ncbi:MAG: hypothetical protein JHC31_06025 [Sulfurihydrogenibium sp.]|nr:hypothetical protein [Sulfurihydrogenibium sp.]
MLLKFTVKTSDLKEALKKLNSHFKNSNALFFEFKDYNLRLWVHDLRFDDIFDYEISVIQFENKSSIGWIALDKEQIKQFKHAIKYYKNEFITIEIKENENYKLRLPRSLKYKLIVNGHEIEIT